MNVAVEQVGWVELAAAYVESGYESLAASDDPRGFDVQARVGRRSRSNFAAMEGRRRELDPPNQWPTD
jgi:hypothetical protein